MKCSICNAEILHERYSHNPEPVRKAPARCCEYCNYRYVLPARVMFDMKDSSELNNRTQDGLDRLIPDNNRVVRLYLLQMKEDKKIRDDYYMERFNMTEDEFFGIKE